MTHRNSSLIQQSKLLLPALLLGSALLFPAGITQAQDGFGEPGQTPDRNSEPTRKHDSGSDDSSSNWKPVFPSATDRFIKGYDNEIKAIEDALKETEKSSEPIVKNRPDNLEINDAIKRAERFIKVQEKDISSADTESLLNLVKLKNELDDAEKKLKPYLDDDGFPISNMSPGEKAEYEAYKLSYDFIKDQIKSELDSLKSQRDSKTKFLKEKLEAYKKQLKTLEENGLNGINPNELFKNLKQLEKEILTQRLNEMKAMKKQMEGKSAAGIRDFKDNALFERTGFIHADALGDAFREIWTQGSSSRPPKKYKDAPKINLPLGEEELSEKEKLQRAYDKAKAALKDAEKKKERARNDTLRKIARDLAAARSKYRKEARKKFKTKAEQEAWVKEQMKEEHKKYDRNKVRELVKQREKELDQRIADLKKARDARKDELDGKPKKPQPSVTAEKTKKKPKPGNTETKDEKEALPVVNLPLGEPEKKEKPKTTTDREKTKDSPSETDLKKTEKTTISEKNKDTNEDQPVVNLPLGEDQPKEDKKEK